MDCGPWGHKESDTTKCLTSLPEKTWVGVAPEEERVVASFTPLPIVTFGVF